MMQKVIPEGEKWETGCWGLGTGFHLQNSQTATSRIWRLQRIWVATSAVVYIYFIVAIIFLFIA